MRDDSIDEDSSSSLSWATLKEQGKAAFERGDYALAIKKYSLALQPDRNCPATERQILLSNMVAARLQIGGPTQAEAAVENAKQVSDLVDVVKNCYNNFYK
jgi:Flp pilus assembly protein TadD